MYEFYGISPEVRPVTFETWDDRLHPEDRERAKAEVQAATTGEQQYDTEFRVILANGSLRHIKADALVVRDENGRAVRMIGINADITLRKQWESELAQHGEKLEEQVKQRTEELNTIIKELHGEIAERLKAEKSLQETEEALRQLNADLDQRVQERNRELEKKYSELERINKMFVGRELRMIELKDRIRELEER